MYNMTIEIGIKFEIRTISSVNGGDDKNTKTCRDGGTTKAKLRKVTGEGSRNFFPKSVTVP